MYTMRSLIMNNYSLNKYKNMHICTSLKDERPQVYYKELNFEIKKNKNEGIILFDFNICNDHNPDNRFFKTTYNSNGIQWNKLKSLSDDDIEKDIKEYCDNILENYIVI